MASDVEDEIAFHLEERVRELTARGLVAFQQRCLESLRVTAGTRGVLRELHRGGATIVMVTHHPRCADFAGRSIHFFDGRIVEDAGGPGAAALADELEEHGFDLH